jgi:integrase
MPAKVKPLTVKFIEHVSKAGTYADGEGRQLVVGPGGKSKSMLQRYRFKGKRREMGLGPVRNSAELAAAREKSRKARKLIAEEIDPLEHRKQQERTNRLANVTFKAIADDMIDNKSKLGEEPWREQTTKDAKYAIGKYLAPIHNRPIDQITAVDLFDLVLKPLLEKKAYRTTAKARTYALGVFKWGYGRGVLKVEHANPASLNGPLGVLLHSFKHRGGHLPSLDWQKVPALIAEIQAHIHGKSFTLSEAAVLFGKPKVTIRDHILRGQLKADRELAGMHPWRVEMTELLKLGWQPVTELPPTPKTLASYLLLVSILTALRPSEARFLQWTEYDPIEKLLTIPWQRTKEGRKILRDHIIPLHRAIIEIFDLLRNHQQREGIYRPNQYIFAQFPSGNKRAKALWPPHANSVLNTLRQFLGPEDIDKSLHAMRDAFGSWSDERGFREKDKERALGHIKGFGEDDVSRRYNRQSKRLIALTELFCAWAEFCLGGSEPSKVIPIRKHLKQAGGGG